MISVSYLWRCSEQQMYCICWPKMMAGDWYQRRFFPQTATCLPSDGRNGVLVFASSYHDGVTKWKHFPRYWPFVWGIHRTPVNSPHKGQWHGALVFSLICAMSKQSTHRWFETPSRPLWLHCYVHRDPRSGNRIQRDLCLTINVQCTRQNTLMLKIRQLWRQNTKAKHWGTFHSIACSTYQNVWHNDAIWRHEYENPQKILHTLTFILDKLCEYFMRDVFCEWFHFGFVSISSWWLSCMYHMKFCNSFHRQRQHDFYQ